jgi:hypothetical protein
MNKYPLSHGFDKNAIKRFIDSADDSVKEICKKIIDATLYVSFEKTLLELNKRINEYYQRFGEFHLKNERPVFIFNPDTDYYKKKSNYWFSSYIFKKMNELFENKVEIIGLSTIYDVFNHPELIKDDIIIVPDDCIYSGNQLSTNIGTFASIGNIQRFYVLITYASTRGVRVVKNQFVEKYGIELSYPIIQPSQSSYSSTSKPAKSTKPTKPTKPNQKSNIFSTIPINIIDNNYKSGGTKIENKKYLELPIIFDDSIKNIKNDNYDHRLIFSTYITIPSLMNIISINEFLILSSYYNNSKVRSKNIRYNTYLIYFDHKLADTISVPTIFYLGIVPNEHNKQIINSDDFEAFANENRSLTVIPFISKCSYYTQNLNLGSPDCPKPPYKKDFEETVRKMGLQTRSLDNISKSKSKSKSKPILKKYRSSI